MTDSISLGIIGCGIISRAHLDAVSHVPGARVVAAANATEARLHAVADEFAIPTRYRDWRRLVADPAVQAVIVCLPEGLHAPVAIEAARHGKHILVEKPMSRRLAETDLMIAAARDAGVQLMVAQVLRRFPNHALAKRWIAENKIGPISHILRRRLMTNALPDFHRRPWASDPALAGDWLLHGFGSHEFDAILWLLDTQAESVTAQGRRDSPAWPGWSDISATVTLRHGVAATVTLSLVSETPAWDTLLTGPKGALAIHKDAVELNGEKTRVPPGGQTAFQAQMAEFVACVRQNTEPGPSGANVRNTMALLEAVERSLTEKRPVLLTEFTET